MEQIIGYQLGIIAIFIIGYLLIVFEEKVHLNKGAISLVMAVIAWGMIFMFSPVSLHGAENLTHHLSSISEVIFFLIGAMTIVELIDSHQGFHLITSRIQTRSRVKMLWIISLVSFFLSSVLDNLTTTIVMISLLRKLIKDKEDRWLLGSMVVIAANAGGAWTPMGDVTTTMLWIGGQLTAVSVMKALFIPSLVSLVAALILQTFFFGRKEGQLEEVKVTEQVQPWGSLICCVGVGFLILVPVLKALIHLPPYMGMLIGLGTLWLMTDLLHRHDENRHHLMTPAVLRKIDVSSVLFFLGILLSVSALETAGILSQLASGVDAWIPGEGSIAAAIGLASSVVDNVPLVAGTMGMYNLSVYPVDCPFWLLIAYAAGTGGSILIIGSAAGVALMGMEKMDFFWYLKRVSLTALIGYFAGFGAYYLQQLLV